MDQISKPYRIALGAMLVLAVAWFLFLRPGGSEPADVAAAPVTTTAAPSAPGVKGLTDDVARARGAAAAQERSDAATQAAVAQTEGGTTPTTATRPSTTSTPAAPSASAARAARPRAAADPAGAVLDDLRRGDVAVVAFVQPGGADDADVRRALRGLSGPVRTHVADIDRVGDYGAITNGVPVTEAPTTLVISADRRARVLTGLTGVRELQQVVDDQAQ